MTLGSDAAASATGGVINVGDGLDRAEEGGGMR